MNSNFLTKHYTLREVFAGIFTLACVLYAIIPAIPSARMVRDYFPYTPQYQQHLLEMRQLSAKIETEDLEVEVGAAVDWENGDFYLAQYAFVPRKVIKDLNTFYVLTYRNDEPHPGFTVVAETELFALYRMTF